MANKEIGQILSLLDSGEWGELQSVIDELKESGNRVQKAEAEFSAKFERAEWKRLKLFENRFMTSGLGICQAHWWSPGADQTDVLPLENLKVVQQRDVRLIACTNCIATSFQQRENRVEIGDSPTPKQIWTMMQDKEKYKMAKHFKMPSLRDF